MSKASEYHRPLVSGIRIQSGKDETRRGVRSIWSVGAGTLTGLATRNSDGMKLLVTNMHVMAGKGTNKHNPEPFGRRGDVPGIAHPGQ